ncbi:10334_t:CDS:1, partial [Entrophospora sp. SA101]
VPPATLSEIKVIGVTNCHAHMSTSWNSSGDPKEIDSQNSSMSFRQPIPRTNPNKMECLYQYAIGHGMDPKKFSVITEAEKNRWAMGCFREDLERDIHFYRGGIERQEDTIKYHEFLTDRERLVGEELLRHGIIKSGL